MSYNIYWDHQSQKLVPSLNSQQAVTRFDFILRDALPVVLRVCNAQSNINVPYIVTAVDAGKVVHFGAKELATYATDANFLFEQDTWVETGTGETTIYSASIPLNTAALISAMTGLAYLDCKAEFAIWNGAQDELSTQVTFRIWPDVIQGTEA